MTRLKYFGEIERRSREVQLETTLDEADIAILRQIEQHSDLILATLADDLALSRSVKYHRLNKLRDEGVIETTSADADSLKIDLNE